MGRHHERRGAARGAATAAALLAALAACDGLLEVERPSNLPATGVEEPGNASLLVNSAVGEFECAFGAYVVLGGLVGDELQDGTQTADRYPYDRRNHTSADGRYASSECDALGVYTPLNRARAAADNVLTRLEGWTDAEVANRTRLIGTAATYAGYSLTLLGEGFCAATISSFDADGQIVYGTLLTPDQVLAQAEERFTRAIAAATAAGDNETLRTALVGRARARLDRGRYAEARADAALVPAGFVKNATAEASSSRRTNRVWAQNSATSDATSVGPYYRTLGDPRIPVTDKAKNAVTGIPLWRQDKYPTAGSPIPLATYEEARLIIAEADARAGGASLANAIAIVNEIRARGGQGPISNASTQGEVLAEIVEQRRRELFLESHHLGDFIRYNLPLSPAPGAAYHGGGSYGSARCLPLPDVERNGNPNID